MDIKVLKTDILSNNIPNFLIFIEEEPALAKQYITYIANTLSKKPVYFESADEALYDITTGLTEDCLYIIYNDEKLKKNTAYFDTFINFSSKNILVLFESIDKKQDYYKNYKEYYVNFNKLDNNTLLAYAIKLCKNHKCTVDQSKLTELVDYCNGSLGCLINELDKIFTLEQDNSNILVDYMLKNGFSDYRNVNVFSFINKILNKDTTAFDDIIKINDSPVGIIYNLYNSARARLLTTRNSYYVKVMKLCTEVYDGIIDGSFGVEYALKYILMRLYK